MDFNQISVDVSYVFLDSNRYPSMLARLPCVLLQVYMDVWQISLYRAIKTVFMVLSEEYTCICTVEGQYYTFCNSLTFRNRFSL